MKIYPSATLFALDGEPIRTPEMSAKSQVKINKMMEQARKLPQDKQPEAVERITKYQTSQQKILTLGAVLLEVMVKVQQGDDSISAKDKAGMYELMRVIYKADKATPPAPIELESEQITMLKNRLAKNYGPAVYGPAALYLDGKEEWKPEEVPVHHGGLKEEDSGVIDNIDDLIKEASSEKKE